MKAYYYLLFRIYMFYKDTMKEKNLLIFTTSVITTVIITINLMSIYYLFVLNNVFPELPNKYYAIGCGILICFLNYFFIVKNKKFLNYNFQKDKIGGAVVVGFVVLTAIVFITIGNIYRSKMYNL